MPACLHRQRCGAIPRKREASNRIALRGLPFQVVHEPDKGIEADDLGTVGDEVGESVDVIEVELAVAIVNDVLNAADFNIGGIHDALDAGDDIVCWCVTFYADAVLGRVNGAGGAGKLLAAGGAADIGGAEIKCFTGEMDLDAVEEFGADYFDAHDVTIASWDKFLDESGVVEAEIDGGAVGVDGGFEIVQRVELGYACATATDIRLDHDGEAEAFSGSERVRRAVDYARFWIRQPERFKQRKLEGLGGFIAESLLAVDHTLAVLFQVGEVILRVEDALAVSAAIGGGRHAIEDEGKVAVAIEVRRVKVVLGRVDLNVRSLAPVELGEERLEPMRMLVIDGDWLLGL